ncbi:DUF4138 domain-containing protein [Gillisia sp. Q332]|uniref:DUF4138 domain-containing protein n=1 Tax=Gillisia xinjiangensis TaxID=3384765 RepID=UPI00391AFD88
MKKHLFISGLLIIVGFANLAAQEIKVQNPVLDTIYANEHKNVALFFPEPIRQGITGAEDFVFTYNREQYQHLGLLQATPGKESNLLVIGTNGSIFSYILMYSERLDQLNYFISDSGKIGNENPEFNEEHKDVALISATKTEEVLADKEPYYQNFSSYILRSKRKIGNIQAAQENVFLKVENIVFHRDELYFVLKINNRSSIDYDLSLLDISVETRKKGKKKSMQKLIQEPVFRYQVPEKVAKGKISRFVYVLPKFSIAEDKVVVIDLKEQNGERDIKLKVKRKFINNPN